MIKSYAEYAPVFKAMSDETRLKIIDMLSCGELCACDILEGLSISQSTLSYHMKSLTESDLINARKDGSWMKYTLNTERINKMISFLQHITSEKENWICMQNDKKRCK